MKRTRHSTVTIHGLDGTYSGDGENLALAVADVARRHAEEAPVQRYTLTEQGASYLAGMRTREYLDDPSLEGAAKMEAAYELAERLGYWEGQR